MALTLTPLRKPTTFGRTVMDLSIADVLASPHLQQQVREALDTHGMLLFPNQRLTPAEEAAFAKLFPWDQTVPMAECAGPFATAQTTGVYGVGGGGDEGLPAIAGVGGNEGGAVLGVDRWKLPAPLSMVQIQGDGAVRKHHNVPDGELVSSQTFAEWHTDGVHDTPRSTYPPAVTTMYCLVTPPQARPISEARPCPPPRCRRNTPPPALHQMQGGETLFADGRAGFAALPAALQRRARRLSAVFDGRFRQMNPAGTRALPSEVGAAFDGAQVPLTNRWPLVSRDAAGRECLYALAPSFTRHLVESSEEEGEVALSEEESQQLLQQMLLWALQVWPPRGKGGTLLPWAPR